jgi:hypothetical protein
MYTVKNLQRDFWIIFDQIYQELGLGTLFPARGSLISDIPAGVRKSLKLFFFFLQCIFLEKSNM